MNRIRMFVCVLFLTLLIFNSSVGLQPDCLIAGDICPNGYITFWFYTRFTQDNPQQIIVNHKSLEEAVFIRNVETIILIHGYTGGKDYDPNIQIRPAYFEHGEYNIISVDYHEIAKEPCYPAAAMNVFTVGKCTAQLIDELVKTKGIPLKSIHVIGFSLGAQAAGAISNHITTGLLQRITGLDPALPLFVTHDGNKKLDKTDARFVDVIHTNALEKGKLESCGNVDFYMNGGMRQPGCENLNKPAESSCNHARAPIYYAESINTPKGFYGKKCSSWFLYMLGWCRFDENTEEMIMGMNTPETAEGLFFIKTNSQPAYAKGKWTEQELKSTMNAENHENENLLTIEHQSENDYND